MNATEVESTNEQSKRYFTLAEANQRLPLVRAIVSDIVELFRDVTERRQRLIDLIEHNQLGSKRVASPYTEELEQMQEDMRGIADDQVQPRPSCRLHPDTPITHV